MSSIVHNGSVSRHDPNASVDNRSLIPTSGSSVSEPSASTPEQLAMSKVALREARSNWFTSLERPYLAALLRVHGDNVSRIARVAGVDRKTMRRLLRKYGLRAASEVESSRTGYEAVR